MRKLVNNYSGTLPGPVEINYTNNHTYNFIRSNYEVNADSYEIDDNYVRFYGYGQERFKLKIKDCKNLMMELLT